MERTSSGDEPTSDPHAFSAQCDNSLNTSVVVVAVVVAVGSPPQWVHSHQFVAFTAGNSTSIPCSIRCPRVSEAPRVAERSVPSGSLVAEGIS